MVRDVNSHHQIVRKGGIKVMASHFSFVGKAGTVVAIADHPAVIGDILRGLVLLKETNDIGNLLNCSDWPQRHICPIDDARSVHEVTVGVDEAGHQRLAAEIDDSGAGPYPFRPYVARGANRDDLAVLDGDRLWRRLGVGHGHDWAAVKDDVGRRIRCGGCIGGGRPPCHSADGRNRAARDHHSSGNGHVLPLILYAN